MSQTYFGASLIYLLNMCQCHCPNLNIYENQLKDKADQKLIYVQDNEELKNIIEDIDSICRYDLGHPMDVYFLFKLKRQLTTDDNQNEHLVTYLEQTLPFNETLTTSALNIIRLQEGQHH